MSPDLTADRPLGDLLVELELAVRAGDRARAVQLEQAIASGAITELGRPLAALLEEVGKAMERVSGATGRALRFSFRTNSLRASAASSGSPPFSTVFALPPCKTSRLKNKIDIK